MKRPMYSVREFDVFVPEDQVFKEGEYLGSEACALFMSSDKMNKMFDMFWDKCVKVHKEEIANLKKQLRTAIEALENKPGCVYCVNAVCDCVTNHEQAVNEALEKINGTKAKKESK